MIKLNQNDPVSILKGMLIIRKIEEILVSEYPKQEMRCPVHFSIGQEGIAIGVSLHLNKNDWVVSNHRSHAHYIAKGGNVVSFFAELYGKAEGCCAGRGGSMHLTDLGAGFLAGVPIVGSGLAIAAGVAMSQKWNKVDAITVAYIGDAAVESGTFHETLNFASLHELPLLVVCENNEFSIFTPLSVRQPSNRSISDLASSHGIKTYTGNGDDVLEVSEIMQRAKSYMLSEKKPAFIEFNTFRLLEHCGPNFDDNLGYRDQNVVESYAERDPLTKYLNELKSRKLIDENQFNALAENTIVNIYKILEEVKLKENAHNLTPDSVYWSKL